MIAARDLHFRYRPDMAELFGGLSHSFAEGTVTGLVGPSGCGKSTLLFILGLMLRPTRGQVELDREMVSGWSDRKRSWLRATRMGFVFQEAALDSSRSVLDNVLEPTLYNKRSRAEATPEAMELLAQFGIEIRYDHLPGQVSGGQAQRVALCRALINQPQVLLADEPTGNLDPESTRWVTSALQEFAQAGGTVIIATHDSFVMDQCDDVVALG